jgi:uncharacterized protein (TIGR00725 family)
MRLRCAAMELTIAVIGSGTADPARDAAAERVGELLGAAGATVVCGGLGGVMAAVCRGARAAGGRTVGLLPGSDRAAANPWVDLAVPTGLGEARNVLVARAGRAVVAIGGGFGTLSELAFARKAGVPVVVLEGWPLDDDGIVHVASADEAAARALALAGA